MAGTNEDTQEDPTPLAPENAADEDGALMEGLAEDGAPIEGVSEDETLSIVTLSGQIGACVYICALLIF